MAARSWRTLSAEGEGAKEAASARPTPTYLRGVHSLVNPYLPLYSSIIALRMQATVAQYYVKFQNPNVKNHESQAQRRGQYAK